MHDHAVPELDRAGLTPRALHADRAHDLLGGHAAGLVESGKVGERHDGLSVADQASHVGDGVIRLWGERQLALTRWPSGHPNPTVPALPSPSGQLSGGAPAGDGARGGESPRASSVTVLRTSTRGRAAISC